VNFAEQPPSQQWAALTFRGEKFAEVWFKPDGDPLGLTFRIPQASFHLPGLGPLLTAENLLKAVAIPTTDVESWRHADAGPNAELSQPLPPPAPDAAYLTLSVRLKPPPQAAAPKEIGAPEHLLEKLQDLEARWNAVLGLEASLSILRQRVESAQTEMQGAVKRVLTTEEKLHALNSDVHQWNKAKSRARYALPKARDFLHRAIWALDTPERKKLGELFKDGLGPDSPILQMAKVPDQLDRLLKDRQVLSNQGGTVYQECTGITAEIQGALRTLQSNSAANAKNKRAQDRKKGKFV
jgi:hypothetical protein